MCKNIIFPLFAFLSQCASRRNVVRRHVVLLSDLHIYRRKCKLTQTGKYLCPREADEFASGYFDSDLDLMQRVMSLNHFFPPSFFIVLALPQNLFAYTCVIA